MKGEPPVALVTGANRGMGLETCRALVQRGYQVILTSRDQQLGQQATQPFVQQGLSVTSFALDVTNEGSIQHLQRVLEERFGGVDVLVNNAAIYPDKGRSVLEVEPETFRATMETNFYGPLLLCQAWVPAMIPRRYDPFVNVSSRPGQLPTSA